MGGDSSTNWGMAMVFGIVVVVATMRLRAARVHANTVGKLIDKLGTSLHRERPVT